MARDWLSRLDEALPPPPQDFPPNREPRAGAAREAVRHMFGMWLAFKFEMDVELDMSPWQWEVVEFLGDGEWRFRKFPFHRLQNVAIYRKESVPAFEVRIAPEGFEGVAFYMVVPEHRTAGRTLVRYCKLGRAPFSGVGDSLRDLIPLLAEKWAESITLGDERILIDWAITLDERETSSQP